VDSILEIQKQCMQDSIEWFGEELPKDLVYLSLALAGEVGEFCNILKKIERGSLEHNNKTQLQLALELTDVFIYVSIMAACLNIDLGAAYDHKRSQNVIRFRRVVPLHGGDTDSPAG
jgi:NTP pyrophosphatase (non-canonical NTP hydrolase)